MLQDLRFALRLLNRHRGYAAVAVLTIALGVGANTAVFSIADSVLFRPLPFADADRLFVLRIGNPQTGEVYGTLPGSGVETARGTGLFDGMAVVSGRGLRAYAQGAGGLEALALSTVSREYLELLNVRPMLGRPFDVSDAGSRAVLLTHRAWMRRYGGNPAIVGTLIPSIVRSLDGANVSDPPLHVIGVLPPRLRLPLLSEEDGITLLDGNALGGPGRTFPPLVRLRPGVSAAAARAQLASLQGADLIPGKSALRLVPLREEIAGSQDPVLWLLLSAAATVLLVACVNLANLIVARGSARTRELAIRIALGGSRARLVRLLVTESVCLAAFGTALGLLAAYAGFRLLSGQLPPLLAAVADPAFDVRALVFAIASASMAALAFGVLPALRLSRADARNGLGLGRLQAQAQASGRGRQLLVAIEVAICLALLVGAGLVGRSLLALLSQDLGFQSRRIVATFDMPTMVVKSGDSVRADFRARGAFFQARLRDLRAVPGVRAAGAGSAEPFSLVRPDAPLFDSRGAQAGGVYSISSGYFRAMGTPLLAGRDLTNEEGFAAAPVGVLNEMAARRICGSVATCIGRVVHAPGQPARTIVGVVRDVRQSVRQAPMPAMYVPFDRFIIGSIVIDSDDTAENREGLRRALATSADVRVTVRSLDAARDREVSPFRFNAIIIGAFALLTLTLALIGIYGVMSAVVGERTREFGIRLALGATRARVKAHVLRQALLPIASGIAVGMMLAVWASSFVASLLYGVVPLDAASFAAAAGVVLVFGLFAALVPACRAGRVDPIVALRAE